MNFNDLKCKIKNACVKWYIRFKGRPYLLYKAKKKADKLHKQTGKRYRVFFFGYKFYVWTREDIKERKRIGLFRDNLKCGADFDKICFYDTLNPERYVFK
ncbi:MAG: hypothetical protein ACK5MA_10410 [Parachlamydiaceae bacterium]